MFSYLNVPIAARRVQCGIAVQPLGIRRNLLPHDGHFPAQTRILVISLSLKEQAPPIGVEGHQWQVADLLGGCMDRVIRNGDAADVLNLMSALVDTVASVTAKQTHVGPTQSII